MLLRLADEPPFYTPGDKLLLIRRSSIRFQANIKFCSKPVQSTRPKGAIFNDKERSIIDSEIHTLLEKGVIAITTPEPGKFIPQFLFAPKKMGSIE